MSTLTRRELLTFGAAGAACYLMPWRAALAGESPVPHFFLQVVFENGWDTSYLFDARPLAMTAAGKIQNYLGEEPTLWAGANGRSTWASPLVEPLRRHAQRLSILNGVHMAATFDGHEQNKNFLLTGNAFGGAMLLPDLNRAAPRASLDFVQVGTLFGVELSNTGGGVILDPSTAVALSAGLGDVGGSEDPAHAYVRERLLASGAATPQSGHFADGAAKMLAGLGGSRALARRLKDVRVDTEGSELRQALSVAHQYFKAGVAQSALIAVTRHNLDTHDAGSAREQPETYRAVVQDLDEILTFLAETPLAEADGPRLIDCTTFVITSEFSRTMRQQGRAIDETGTDHNPQANTVLVGGKGVRSGLVVGESDRRSAEEEVSEAHAKLDGNGLKAMGKPFDFDRTEARQGYDLGEYDVYRAEDYLTYASIANTVFDLFGVPEDRWWLARRNGAPARRLTGLLRG